MGHSSILNLERLRWFAILLLGKGEREGGDTRGKTSQIIQCSAAITACLVSTDNWFWQGDSAVQARVVVVVGRMTTLILFIDQSNSNELSPLVALKRISWEILHKQLGIYCILIPPIMVFYPQREVRAASPLLMDSWNSSGSKDRVSQSNWLTKFYHHNWNPGWTWGQGALHKWPQFLQSLHGQMWSGRGVCLCLVWPVTVHKCLVEHLFFISEALDLTLPIIAKMK